LTDSDHRQAGYLCRQEIQNKRETRTFEACVAETLRNYQILNNSAAARVASQPASARYVAGADLTGSVTGSGWRAIAGGWGGDKGARAQVRASNMWVITSRR